jgi:hypothetical protein
MGQGDFGGNGSVVWNVVHHDAAGNPNGPNPGGTGDPGNNEVTVNPSANAKGKDPATPGSFKVTLRYGNNTDARNALTAAYGTIVDHGSYSTVDLSVPARTAAQRPNRNADPPLEVKVKW